MIERLAQDVGRIAPVTGNVRQVFIVDSLTSPAAHVVDQLVKHRARMRYARISKIVPAMYSPISVKPS
jgi:hypothetical protein